MKRPIWRFFFSYSSCVLTWLTCKIKIKCLFASAVGGKCRVPRKPIFSGLLKISEWYGGRGSPVAGCNGTRSKTPHIVSSHAACNLRCRSSQSIVLVRKNYSTPPSMRQKVTILQNWSITAEVEFSNYNHNPPIIRKLSVFPDYRGFMIIHLKKWTLDVFNFFTIITWLRWSYLPREAFVNQQNPNLFSIIVSRKLKPSIIRNFLLFIINWVSLSRPTEMNIGFCFY